MEFNRGTQDNVNITGTVFNIIQNFSAPNEGAGTSGTTPITLVRSEQLALQLGRDETRVVKEDETSDSTGAVGRLVAQMEKLTAKVVTPEEKSSQEQSKGLESQTSELEDRIKVLEHQNRRLKDQNKRLEAENRRLEDKYDVLKEQRKRVEEQNEELEDRTRDLKEQNKELKVRIRGLESWTGRLERQNKGLEDEKRMLKELNLKLEEQIKGVEEKTRKLEDLNGKLEEKIKGLETEVQELMTRNSASATSRTSGKDVAFVMGGYENVDTVETLDPTVGFWVSHKIPDAPSRWTWIRSVGHKVLVLEWDHQRFRSFDVTTREWTPLRYLPQHRWGYSVAASGDQVYVLGGDAPNGTRSDRYDGRTDSWGETAPMREGRLYAAAVCHEDKIYCSGGRSVPGNRHLTSLEVLDPRGNGHWASLPSMGVRRNAHCLASCGRFLWAIGGHDVQTVLSDVEKYDVEGRKWTRVASLLTPRRLFSSSVVGGRVHVVGGWTTGYTDVRTVEVYDEEGDRWSPAAPLQKERRDHGSCVVLSLPDAVADKFAVPIK